MVLEQQQQQSAPMMADDVEKSQTQLRVTVVDEHGQRRYASVSLPENDDDLEIYSGQCLLDELTRLFPDLRNWAKLQCFCVNEMDCRVSLLREHALLDCMLVLREREMDDDDGLGKIQVHVYQDYERHAGEPPARIIVNLADCSSDDDGWMSR